MTVERIFGTAAQRAGEPGALPRTTGAGAPEAPAGPQVSPESTDAERLTIGADGPAVQATASHVAAIPDTAPHVTAIPDTASHVTATGLVARAPALILVGSAGLALTLLVLRVPPPVSLLVGAFILTCPGIALLRLVRLHEPLLEVVVGVALSAALLGLLTIGQLYLGWWSPTASFVVLAGVTVVAALADAAILPRSARDRAARSAALARTRLTSRTAAMSTGLQGAWREAIARSTVGREPAPPGDDGDRSAVDDQASEGRKPPPPVIVVRDRQADTPIGARRTGRRRQTLGYDPLEQPAPPRALRSTIEKVVDDLADEKDDRPG